MRGESGPHSDRVQRKDRSPDHDAEHRPDGPGTSRPPFLACVVATCPHGSASGGCPGSNAGNPEPAECAHLNLGHTQAIDQLHDANRAHSALSAPVLCYRMLSPQEDDQVSPLLHVMDIVAVRGRYPDYRGGHILRTSTGQPDAHPHHPTAALLHGVRDPVAQYPFECPQIVSQRLTAGMAQGTGILSATDPEKVHAVRGVHVREHHTALGRLRA